MHGASRADVPAEGQPTPEATLRPRCRCSPVTTRYTPLQVLAHAGEAAFAFSICKQLRMGPQPTAAWALAVLAVGYPCLRWLLPMRPKPAAAKVQ